MTNEKKSYNSIITPVEHTENDPLLNILNDIAMSLRVMSGRSKVTNVNNKHSYKDFYFSPSDPE